MGWPRFTGGGALWGEYSAAKGLLGDTSPQLLAGLLYLGSGPENQTEQ
jgi:hypothetical protein